MNNEENLHSKTVILHLETRKQYNMTRIYKYRNIKTNVNRQSTECLVEQFNSQVGKLCWTSARAAHDTTLIDTLIKRGVDVSAIYDGTTISFKHHITLNEDGSAIVITD